MRSDRGAALIIAISVLAALLLLALPFLFSQTASVAGARTAGYGATAGRGSASTEQFAVGIAAYVNALHMTDALGTAQRVYSSLPENLYDDAALAGRVPAEQTDRATFIVGSSPDKYVDNGVEIEDQQGRLDCNAMAPHAWWQLLNAMSIPDPLTWQWVYQTNTSYPNTNIYHWGRWIQAPFGRLSIGLSSHRGGCTGGRYVSLDQLLTAQPGILDIGTGPHDRQGQSLIAPFIPTYMADIRADLDKQGERRAVQLTRVELDRVSRYITIHTLGRGRSGIADLGSVLAVSPLDGDSVSEPLPGISLPGWAWLTCVERDGDIHRVRESWNLTNDAANGPGALVALDIPATINANAVWPTSPVARALGWNPPMAVMEAIFKLPRISLLDPFGGYRNGRMDSPMVNIPGWSASVSQADTDFWTNGRFPIPPIDVTSDGVVAIDASARSLDLQGQNQTQAQRGRRTVVQAVPQERPIRHRWKSQADYLEDNALGRSAQMLTGPHPVDRVTDFLSDITEIEKLKEPGWIAPRPLTMGQNQWISRNWRADFGLTVPRSWADVLKSDDGSGVLGDDAVEFPMAKGSGSSAGALGPHGLRMQAGEKLAYPWTASSGPMRVQSVETTDLMAPRHLAMRFQIEGPVPAGSKLVLMEARQEVDPTNEGQFLWQVAYEANSSMLVLRMANAALGWKTDSSWTMDEDQPNTPDEDERCLPKNGSPGAPAWPVQAVEFRYFVAGGLEAKRWYNLQVVCASEQPGQHALILDGIVGGEAAGAPSRTGDHYTLPSLRLSSTAGVAAATQPLDGGSASLGATPISVVAPGGLSLAAILPSRGLVRIDDEYFTYSGLSGGQLTGIQRARRQDTDQSIYVDTDLDGVRDPGEVPDQKAWPVIQPHIAGARVMPGWSRFPMTSGRWLRGKASLRQPFLSDPVISTVNSGSWPAGSVAGKVVYPAIVNLAGGSPLADWPDKGLVRFNNGHRAAFTKDPLGLKLSWTLGAAGGIVGGGEIDTGSVTSATLVSLCVQDTDELADADLTLDGIADKRFVQGPSHLQLMEPDGRCEWIRYTSWVVRTGPPDDAPGRYFIHDAGGEFGWKMDAYATPSPQVQPRGAMRTVRRGISCPAGPSWPIGTLILPVQAFSSCERLESGDVVTVVPRSLDNAAVPKRVPQQIVVRHAARDGFPLDRDDSNQRYDVDNRYFALSDKVPDGLHDPIVPSGTGVPADALIGRGWCGADLSPHVNTPVRRAQPSRRTGFTHDFSAASVAKVYFGSSSVEPRPVNIVIDDMWSGELPPVDSDATSYSGCTIGTALSGLGVAELPVAPTANGSYFQRVYGLVLIDGETFVYRNMPATGQSLIARGQLGSPMRAHPFIPTATSPAIPRPMYSVLTLPIGPVAELMATDGGAAALPASAAATKLGSHGLGKDLELCDARYDDYREQTKTPANEHQRGGVSPAVLAAHGHLISAPDGLKTEVVRFRSAPDINQVITAPWLRGLYGTAVEDWALPKADPIKRPPTYTDPVVLPTWTPPLDGSGTVNPIVVGLWPRFASPLTTLGLSGEDRAAQLRSRSFHWASYAMRHHGGRFGPSDFAALAGAPEIAKLTVADLGGAYRLEARALAMGDSTSKLADWNSSDGRVVPVTTEGSPQSLTSCFDWGRFLVATGSGSTGREVDGAELRVHWTGAPPAATQPSLETYGAWQGIAPRISEVEMQSLVPTRVLAVENVR